MVVFHCRECNDLKKRKLTITVESLGIFNLYFLK
jgi:hypothetical protein